MRMPPVVASRLRATDVRHFAGDSTFHQVARAVCTADAAIARKELPECWAMAERVHDEFWRSASEPPRRVVDVRIERRSAVVRAFLPRHRGVDGVPALVIHRARAPARCSRGR